MNKLYVSILLSSSALAGLLVGEKPQPVISQMPKTAELNEAFKEAMESTPWIGLQVTPLDQATRAHAKGIPEGVGFLVTKLESGSPAEKAGLNQYDILWKFEDQLLINEAQFGTLLQLHKPGDTIQFTILRSGESRNIDIELASAAERPSEATATSLEIPLFRHGIPGMPKQIVYPEDGAAEITRADGSTARLKYVEDKPYVTIIDKDEKTLFDGPLMQNGQWAVPADWHAPVGALMRAINRSRADEWPRRTPRPRVIIPPNPPASTSR